MKDYHKTEEIKEPSQNLDLRTNQAIGQLIAASGFGDSVLNSLNSHVIVTDINFNITYINQAAAGAWNVEPEKTVGNNLLEAGLYGIPLDLKSNLQKVVREGKSFHVESVQYQNPAHEMRFVRLSYTPLRDNRGKAVGIILVGQDITKQINHEQKQLEYQGELEQALSKKDEKLESVRSRFETDLNELRNRLTEKSLEIERLRLEIKEKYSFHNLVSKSGKMRKIFELVLQLSDNNFPVLITGETGTGKELIAKAVHYNSRRSRHKLVEINCAALTDTLLESELFGHVRGAFTGAVRDKKGKFELADQGSIFLDEIGEMSLLTQAKLLRVLQEKEFDKVGGEKTVKVDVRVIAATNRDLDELIRRKRFRLDLFYRLNVITIQLPPLRERREDIPLLAAHFLEKSNQELKKNIAFISPSALNKMMYYDWPGNVRELRNVIEKAALTTKGNLLEEVDIPDKIPSPQKTKLLGYQAPSLSLTEFLEHCEREYLSGQLKLFKGNIAQVSQASSLNRRTIHNKMKKYRLKKEDYKTISR